MLDLIAIRRLGGAAALVAWLSAAGPAIAQVRCGDVIGPNQTVILAGDITSCPPGRPALTVVGPATLDLNGFAVGCRPSGNETPVGIVVLGKRASVRNGTVEGCATGVRLVGEGAHRVERVAAVASDGGFAGDSQGFRVESGANRLTKNVAFRNRSNGFHVLGARNRLVDNVAIFNQGSGFELATAERTLLRGNAGNENAGVGFRLGNGSRNTLEGNEATGNDTGISASDEESLRLTGNLAEDNREDGIVVLFGSRSRLSRNVAQENGENGIVVGGAQSAVITRNTALNNDQGGASSPRFDLADSLLDCGTNRWVRNVFASANVSCIR